MALQIDLNAVVANYRVLSAKAPQSRAAAVVKADAYGLGAAQVVPALYEAGARDFFVALAQEGQAVRDILKDVPEPVRIFVLNGYMDGDDLTGLIPMLNSPEQYFRNRALRPREAFGVQLDTGMNRLGMEAQEWEALRAEILGLGPALVMSHLACADEPDHPANAAQLAAFRDMTDGIDVPRSLAATGGTLLGPDYHFDLVRPGVGLYGGQPFADAVPAVRLGLRVIQTRDVKPDEFVGYGASHRFTAKRKLATVAGGYADGILRAISGQGAQLYANGQACPIVGRVSMDLITVDVTDLPELPPILDLICAEQKVDDIADMAGTIGYEVLTSLGARYQRSYLPFAD